MITSIYFTLILALSFPMPLLFLFTSLLFNSHFSCVKWRALPTFFINFFDVFFPLPSSYSLPSFHSLPHSLLPPSLSLPIGVITSPDDYSPETVAALREFLDTTASVSELRPGKFQNLKNAFFIFYSSHGSSPGLILTILILSLNHFCCPYSFIFGVKY